MDVAPGPLASVPGPMPGAFDRPRDQNRVAVMWSLAPMVPICALATTTIVYLVPGIDTQPPLLSPALGLAIALAIYALAVLLAGRGAARDRSVRTRAEVGPRLALAAERLRQAAEHAKGEDRDVVAQLQSLIRELESDLLESGAVDRDPVGLWRVLHRVEEGLLRVAPTAEVVAEVVSDRQRLLGSSIPNADGLKAAEEAALNVLDPRWTETVIKTVTTGAREVHRNG